MGFLDHSKNNIIIDAILTDVGREFLARNDKSFSITQFALGDDEIDYGVIEQYGRTVGKEKVEKNTPILEAFTKSNMSLKYRASSISDPFVTHFPTLTITGLSNNILKFAINSDKQKSNVLNLTISNTQGTPIPDDIADFDVVIEVDNRFLGLRQPVDMITSDNIAVYTVATKRLANGDFQLATSINTNSITDSTFNTFSIASGAYIRSFIKVRGFSSGITKNIEAQI